MVAITGSAFNCPRRSGCKSPLAARAVQTIAPEHYRAAMALQAGRHRRHNPPPTTGRDRQPAQNHTEASRVRCGCKAPGTSLAGCQVPDCHHPRASGLSGKETTLRPTKQKARSSFAAACLLRIAGYGSNKSHRQPVPCCGKTPINWRVPGAD